MKQTLSFDKMMDVMRDNFEYMQKSPLVKSLRKENSRLVKENKLLMSIIKDFHITKASGIEKKPVVIDLSQSDDDEAAEVPPVKIKIEKVEKTGENIVYELIEKEIVETVIPSQPEEEEEEEEEEEVEVEEEVEEDVEEEVEVEVEEEVEEQLEVEVEEDETEVYEVTIRSKKYFTTNQQNGKIYEIDSEGEVGNEIGKFVNGTAVFNKK
jgi:hypothetical protein